MNNNDITLNINHYPGAAMYAKSHNISFKQLVESFLMTFPVPSLGDETIDGDLLEQIDESLMAHTFQSAHQDYLAGKCVPNSQVVDYIKKELGWT